MVALMLRRWGAVVAAGGLAAAAGVGSLMIQAVSAAPPYSVTYRGTPVTSAVPGKPVTVNFKVANTGNTVYSGVKVIFHIPEGMTHSNVSPANSVIVDDTVTWEDVPIEAGGTFNPSLTVTLDSGTRLGTKKNIWVQVIGTDLEEDSQNFSVKAVASLPAATASTSSSSSLVSQINAIHRVVYGRNPTASEHAYWLGRVTRGEKSTYGALLGAMQFHELLNIGH